MGDIIFPGQLTGKYANPEKKNGLIKRVLGAHAHQVSGVFGISVEEVEGEVPFWGSGSAVASGVKGHHGEEVTIQLFQLGLEVCFS